MSDPDTAAVLEEATAAPERFVLKPQAGSLSIYGLTFNPPRAVGLRLVFSVKTAPLPPQRQISRHDRTNLLTTGVQALTRTPTAVAHPLLGVFITTARGRRQQPVRRRAAGTVSRPPRAGRLHPHAAHPAAHQQVPAPPNGFNGGIMVSPYESNTNGSAS